jgi:hypothetical protein
LHGGHLGRGSRHHIRREEAMRVRNREILTALISIVRSTRPTWGTVPACIINEKLRENVDADLIVDLARVKERRSPDRRPKLNGGWEAAAPWRSPPPY